MECEFLKSKARLTESGPSDRTRDKRVGEAKGTVGINQMRRNYV